MKYRYYIVDTIDGDVRGTNDEKTAEEYSLSEDNFVVDAEAGEHICMGTLGQRFSIESAKEINRDAQDS